MNEKHLRYVGDGVENICNEGFAGIGAVPLGLCVGARIVLAQRRGPRVAALDGAARGGEGQGVAVEGVELHRGDDFGEFLHVVGLDVHHVCKHRNVTRL